MRVRESKSKREGKRENERVRVRGREEAMIIET